MCFNKLKNINYLKTINWILQKIPNVKPYKSGLDKIKKFCLYLGNPQNFFKSIHIGGTNGKGSTVHMLSSILQEEKYLVGSLTSPHLTDFRERITCNGNLIEKDFIVDFIKNNKKYIEKENISFFEINTALSFQYFKEKKIDIAVIEVGIGGRLDSTNIINPILSIITSISIDHENILGNNKIKIAFEKAGIIKNYISVIIGENITKNIKIFLLKNAIKKNAPIYFTTKSKEYKIYKIPFKVDYQFFNRNLVLKIVNILKNRKHFFISDISIINGFKNVIKNTNIRGRWHILKNSNPKIICDIAHNEQGMYMINLQLKKENYKELHLVLGFVYTKNLKKLLKYFPTNSNYYFCQPDINRKYHIDNIKKLLKSNVKNKFYFYNTVKEAYFMAKKKAKKNDIILVSGSTFVVSEVFLL